MNLSHLEPIDCPLPNLQIFLACVISGIDLIFHSFYRDVVLTSWDRGMSDCTETHPLLHGGTDLMGLQHEWLRVRPTPHGGLTSWDRSMSGCE